MAYAGRALAGFIATGPLVGIWWLLVLQPHPWRAGLVAVLGAIPVVPLIVAAIATAAGTFATTGRLMRWLPEASTRQALAATIAVAALAVTGDVAVIGAYLVSGRPMQPLAAHRGRREPDPHRLQRHRGSTCRGATKPPRDGREPLDAKRRRRCPALTGVERQPRS